MRETRAALLVRMVLQWTAHKQLARWLSATEPREPPSDDLRDLLPEHTTHGTHRYTLDDVD